MKTGVKALIIIFATAAITYMAAVMYRQKKLLDGSCLAISRLQLGIGGGLVNITAELLIKNRTEIALNILSHSLRFYLNNQYAGYSTSDIRLTIPALSEVTIPVNLSFNPMSILKNITDVYNGQLRIEGKISLTSGLVYFNQLPIDQTIMVSDILNSQPKNKC